EQQAVDRFSVAQRLQLGGALLRDSRNGGRQAGDGKRANDNGGSQARQRAGSFSGDRGAFIARRPAWARNKKGPPDRAGGPGSSLREESADDFVGLEEEVDLDLRVLVAVGAVDRVCFDALGEPLAYRALGGVG